MQPGKALFEKFLRIGFDADESRGVVFYGRLAQKQRGKSAANFDDQTRLEMTDHAVSDQRVCAIKEMVIEIKVNLFFTRRCWKPLIFTLEFWKARSQQIELHGAVHIDTHQFTRPIPQRFGQALSIRNGLIEVHRCYMEAMPFPGRKYLLKFCALEAKRHDRRDELRKLHYVDGLPHHRELT